MNETNDMIIKDETLSRKEKFCLSNCYVGADYDMTLKFFSDKYSETPECSHHMRGSGKHSLCKILTVGGLIVASVAALICITHLFCSWVCRVR